jgi:predicted transcriptional regulator
MKKSASITFRIDPATKHDLELVARMDDREPSQTVRIAVKDYLRRWRERAEPARAHG